ncbi:MAG: Ger(x)C family spore germination protein [Firmicutes bacterium]|nr:Ger(x)C family spore germination protein [Bacillota bacterium]
MKRFLLSICILLTLSLTGCWGKKELGDISIVRATGIDMEPNGDIRVTILAEEPTGSKETSASMRSSTWIGSDTGSNIREAMKKLLSHSAKRPLWIQNQVIIISEDVANKALKETLDFFVRNREIRLDNNILISKARVYDLLQLPSSVQSNLVDYLIGMIENTKFWSESYIADLKTYALKYTDDYVSPVTGSIDYYNTTMKTVSTGRESYGMLKTGDSDIGIPVVEGCAAIKKDGSIGVLTYDETQGFLWIMGKVKEGVIEIEGPEYNGKLVMININSKIDKKAIINEDEVEIVLNLQVNGDIGIDTTEIDLSKDTLMKNAEKDFSKKIENQLRATVKRAQKDFKTDIFCFSEILIKKHPNAWKSMESDWENIYENLKITYKVETTIHRMGMLNESLYQ